MIRIAIPLLATVVSLFGCVGPEKKTTEATTNEISRSIEEFNNRPIYKQLTVELLSKVKDEDLEQTIVDNITTNMEGDTRDEKEIIKSLSPGQRAIYVIMIVEGEV